MFPQEGRSILYYVNEYRVNAIMFSHVYYLELPIVFGQVSTAPH